MKQKGNKSKFRDIKPKTLSNVGNKLMMVVIRNNTEEKGSQAGSQRVAG